MRIKLSQSMDFERVPGKLVELSIEGLVELERCVAQTKILSATLIAGQVEASMPIMERLRLLLYALDTKLQDSQEIATSFVEILKQAATETPQRHSDDGDASPEPPDAASDVEVDYSTEKAQMEEFDFSTDSQSEDIQSDGEKEEKEEEALDDSKA